MLNKADLTPADDNITKIRNTGLEVVPCVCEAEALLRRATKKRLLNYLPGDNSFNLKVGVSLNEGQKKALDIVRSLIAKYGSTGGTRSH